MPMTATTPRLHREVVPSSVLGMLLFVAVEVMFFAGLISAFTISREGARVGQWTLPTEPFLPAAATAVNTVALLASGATLLWAGWQYRRGLPGVRRSILASCVLGAAFVGLQGREWVGLLADGMTLWSSPLGAFFYVIVGAHAVHAVAALAALAVAWWRLGSRTLSPGFFLGAATFWYFVVGIWPVIYLRVYF